ncbi:hypothetical protein B0H15DRAFT_568255 [Mycena belliarum]|uniref:Uncharacterized protein n=1 Tax=Mycena belliarum TaxID=1033014 RepID=A0AAD6TRP0_9AGAR|nr:hypothetical protein B0H15DRAFT_567625 [Mycena belliae]KAJ7077119.1 hypothetical protein B0H15DRAFT_568255 [Mycena belliae]
MLYMLGTSVLSCRHSPANIRLNSQVHTPHFDSSFGCPATRLMRHYPHHARAAPPLCGTCLVIAIPDILCATLQVAPRSSKNGFRFWDSSEQAARVSGRSCLNPSTHRSNTSSGISAEFNGFLFGLFAFRRAPQVPASLSRKCLLGDLRLPISRCSNPQETAPRGLVLIFRLRVRIQIPEPMNSTLTLRFCVFPPDYRLAPGTDCRCIGDPVRCI